MMTSNREIYGLFAGIKDAETMKRLFSELFTPAEIQDVALRWRLMNMLHEGTSQREIARKLKISLCKITRGSKVLKKKNSATRDILNQTKGKQDASSQKIRELTG